MFFVLDRIVQALFTDRACLAGLLGHVGFVRLALTGEVEIWCLTAGQVVSNFVGQDCEA